MFILTEDEILATEPGVDRMSPKYIYACDNEDCNHRFEKTQPITAKPLKRCPKCKKNSLYRVIGAVGIQFNCGGFYVTDKGGE